MDGYLFGYLRRKAINDRKGIPTNVEQVEQLCAQRDALIDVIETLVPEDDVRKNVLNPLYHKLLREECRRRNVPFPRFES